MTNSGLLDTLFLCPDISLYNIIDLLPDLPFKEEIINNTFDISNKTIGEIEEAIMTYSFLCIESTELVKELVWRNYNKYFIKSEKYIVNPDIHKYLYYEFKRVFPREYTLEELGCKSEDLSYEKVILSGNIRLLTWMLDNIPYDKTHRIYLFNIAVGTGNFVMIKLLKDKDFLWNETSCMLAIQHIDILKWLRTNGCPWDARTFDMAVKLGDISLIKWLNEEKCPWDEYTYKIAEDNLEILSLIK